jgi:N-glycosylase/DNA lyase
MDEPALRALGLGYRAPYLLDAARRVADGRLNLDLLAALPDGPLQAALLTVRGVGVKVADCVMLFAYHRLSRAPVDVWIRRVIDCAYGGVSPYEGYGPYAGVYQQYQFMCIRDGQLPETR